MRQWSERRPPGMERAAPWGGIMLKVLIADDHPLFRDALHGAVTAVRSDALVVEAASLAGVLDLVRDDDDLDLALLDLRMPGMDGLAGLVMLRKVKPELPVAIVSALADEDTVARCLACGLICYQKEAVEQHG